MQIRPHAPFSASCTASAPAGMRHGDAASVPACQTGAATLLAVVASAGCREKTCLGPAGKFAAGDGNRDAMRPVKPAACQVLSNNGHGVDIVLIIVRRGAPFFFLEMPKYSADTARTAPVCRAVRRRCTGKRKDCGTQRGGLLSRFLTLVSFKAQKRPIFGCRGSARPMRHILTGASVPRARRKRGPYARRTRSSAGIRTSRRGVRGRRGAAGRCRCQPR